MTIEGFFAVTDPLTRPRLSVVVYLPRLDVSRPLDLEIDTGADETILSWRDRLGFLDDPAAEFDGYESAAGATGSALFGTEPAIILASDTSQPGGWYAYPVRLWIALDAQHSPAMSLLGRDFMTNLVLHMDIARRSVYFDTPAP